MTSLLKMLSAALLSTALFSCSAGAPAFAQEGCISLDAGLAQAAEAEKVGAEVHILTGAKAELALALMVDKLGPPPRPIEITTVILAIGPGAAVVMLGESTKACFTLAIPRALGAEILAKVEGVPA